MTITDLMEELEAILYRFGNSEIYFKDSALGRRPVEDVTADKEAPNQYTITLS